MLSESTSRQSPGLSDKSIIPRMGQTETSYLFDLTSFSTHVKHFSDCSHFMPFLSQTTHSTNWQNGSDPILNLWKTRFNCTKHNILSPKLRLSCHWTCICSIPSSHCCLMWGKSSYLRRYVMLRRDEFDCEWKQCTGARCYHHSNLSEMNYPLAHKPFFLLSQLLPSLILNHVPDLITSFI